MARFFAEKVLGPRNPTILPFAEEDLEASIVDGKGDCGVDFISRENGVVLNPGEVQWREEACEAPSR